MKFIAVGSYTAEGLAGFMKNPKDINYAKKTRFIKHATILAQNVIFPSLKKKIQIFAVRST